MAKSNYSDVYEWELFQHPQQIMIIWEAVEHDFQFVDTTWCICAVRLLARNLRLLWGSLCHRVDHCLQATHCLPWPVLAKPRWGPATPVCHPGRGACAARPRGASSFSNTSPVPLHQLFSFFGFLLASALGLPEFLVYPPQLVSCCGVVGGEPPAADLPEGRDARSWHSRHSSCLSGWHRRDPSQTRALAVLLPESGDWWSFRKSEL